MALPTIPLAPTTNADFDMSSSLGMLCSLPSPPSNGAAANGFVRFSKDGSRAGVGDRRDPPPDGGTPRNEGPPGVNQTA